MTQEFDDDLLSDAKSFAEEVADFDDDEFFIEILTRLGIKTLGAEMTRLRVWKTMFSVPNMGYFVWDINECDDSVTEADEKRYPNTYLKLRDGSYVLQPYCNHFWSKERALNYLNDKSYPELVDPIVIEGKNND